MYFYVFQIHCEVTIFLLKTQILCKFFSIDESGILTKNGAPFDDAPLTFDVGLLFFSDMEYCTFDKRNVDITGGRIDVNSVHFRYADRECPKEGV